MIAAVVLGLLIGLTLGALGGGGSILAVPVLAHIAGQSVSAATATSLVAVAAAAAVGSISHARKGNIRWAAGAWFVVTGIAGSWVGTRLNARLEGDVLLLAFSALVLVAAHRMLTACPSCTNVGEERALADPVLRRSSGAAAPAVAGGEGSQLTAMRVEPPPAHPPATRTGPRSIATMVVAGTAVGFLTGLFGVGGGFVIVPALTLAIGMTMPQAIGTSLLVIVGNSLVALAFRGLGSVDWNLAVPFTATMLVGSLVGSMVGHRLPAKRSLQAFAGLLVLVALANGVAAGLGLIG